VFVVGYLGDWRVAAAVLFERESLQGNPKPSRKKREEVASDAQGSVRNPSTPRVSNALCARGYKGAKPEADEGAPLIIDRAAFNQGENAQYEPRIETGETMSSLVAKGPHAVAQPMAVDIYNQTINEHTTQTIRSQFDTDHIGAVLQSMAIRRLTPKECERLQGFPDDWTKIPYRNKPVDQCPDGPRYKACGNSMAVPVMRWIGERINLIESML
jgi:DNA (cytosine-5)-methyltransferase 1